LWDSTKHWFITNNLQRIYWISQEKNTAHICTRKLVKVWRESDEFGRKNHDDSCSGFTSFKPNNPIIYSSDRLRLPNDIQKKELSCMLSQHGALIQDFECLFLTCISYTQWTLLLTQLSILKLGKFSVFLSPIFHFIVFFFIEILQV
jgi:hypothetical protein